MTGSTASRRAGHEHLPDRLLERLLGSTRRRLLAGLLVALTVSGGLLTLTAVTVGQNNLRKEQEADARRLATLFEASLHNAMLQRDLTGLSSVLDTLGKAPGVARAGLLDIHGDVRFASDPAWTGRRLTDPISGLCLDRNCAGPATARSRWQATPEGNTLQLAYPIANQARCAGCHGTPAENPVNGVLVVDFHPPAAHASAHDSALRLLAIGLAALTLFGAIMAWTLQHLITRPLTRLTRAADRLAEGETTVRVGLGGSDEFARLSRHFDAMAQRLDTTLETLRSQQDFLQRLVDAMPDPVLVIGADHRIRLANRAYSQLIGQPPEDIEGACCHRIGRGLAEPCPSTLVSCPLAELARPGAPAHLRTVMTLRHADGTEIPVDIEAAPLQLDGEAGVVEVLRPLARSIRFSQEQRLATIGLLANGVAHEIHNPLASIRLALQASLRGLHANAITHAELIDYLELVDDQIDRAVLATDRLMQMSHPPGEQPGPVSAQQAVDDVLALLAEECRQRGVRTQVHLFPSDARVIADRAGLRQVLVNLVHNALHAMPRGGDIRIEMHPADDPDLLTLTVSDTGPGIAAEDLPRIFLPFFSRRPDGQPGMGLGLAICKSLMDHFGGSISVRSQPGTGTTFTLRLRKAPGPADSPAAPP